VNASELVERLWRDVKRRELVEEATNVPALAELELTAESGTLRSLNLLWDIPMPTAPPDATTVRSKLKRRVALAVLDLLRPHLEAERDFRARSVQMLNALAANDDTLAREIRDIADALRLESRRLAERSDVLHNLLENRLEDLERRTTRPT
jgi:hypothetical protein